MEEIYDIFYKNFFKKLKDLNNSSLEKIFASKLPNNIESIEYVLKENMDAKIVYVDRSTIGLVKTKNFDTFKKLHNLSIDKFNENFYVTSKSKFVDKICDEKKELKELKKYPDKIFLSSLENIVFNTKKELEDILNFCNLDYNECVNYPSYCFKRIADDHLLKINDDTHELNNKIIFLLH